MPESFILPLSFLKIQPWYSLFCFVSLGAFGLERRAIFRLPPFTRSLQDGFKVGNIQHSVECFISKPKPAKIQPKMFGFGFLKIIASKKLLVVFGNVWVQMPFEEQIRF